MPNEHPKTLVPERAYVHGPRIDGSPGLSVRLAGQRDSDDRPALVQIPMLVTISASGDTVASAELAVPTGPRPRVALDDCSMGVPLAERVRLACPGVMTCRVWLEGNWSVSVPSDVPTMRVLRLVRALSPEEATGALQARVAVDVDADLELVAALGRLGLPLPTTEKSACDRQLIDAGTASIPLLIASLDDDRTYATFTTAIPNAPPDAASAPRATTLSVGQHANDLLHTIVTPSPRSAIPQFKVYSEQVLSIPDWRAFWNKRRHRSLAEIHAELLPLVEAYWTQHGTTQRVDWHG